MVYDRKKNNSKHRGILRFKKITIGVLGGHSALDVCRGAKKHGFRTLAVCQKGRDKTYTKYYKTRDDGRGCIDKTIVLDKFSEITKPQVQEQLREENTIFVHNRYFWYTLILLISKIISKSRSLERALCSNLRNGTSQKTSTIYSRKQESDIRSCFKSPNDINRLTIVKVNEAIRGYERAFFFASSLKISKRNPINS